MTVIDATKKIIDVLKANKASFYVDVTTNIKEKEMPHRIQVRIALEKREAKTNRRVVSVEATDMGEILKLN